MKNVKLRGVIAAVSGALCMSFGANAMADSTDDIVNALIAKGVLTEEEGSLLLKGREGEKEAAAKKSKGAVTATYKDGIVIGTEDGKNSLTINGRVHFDSRHYDYDEDYNGVSSGTGADTFDIRRARIGVKARFLDYYEGEVVFNGTGSAPTLDVAYLNIGWWKPAQIRVGQFKMPFSMEQLTSSNNIDFVERSFVDSLIPAKEIGAMLHGSPIAGVNYGLAFSNGAGQNGVEGDASVDDKDIVGRVAVNFAELAGNKDWLFHTALAYSKGDIAKNQGLGVSGRTEARGASFLTTLPGVGNNAAGVNNEIDRTRLGLEAAVAYGPFKLQTQWVKASFDYNPTATTSVDEDVKAFYAQALWTITGESQVSRYRSGAFSSLKPKNNFDPKNFTGGAWEAGVRYSKFDASDFRSVAGTGLGFLEADAWTVGLKFVPNPHVRFMLDYVKTDFEEAAPGFAGVGVNGKNEDDEKAILFRTQFAF
ncbi:Porin O [Methylophilaceae bacterium]|nr:Porin O [Methylophilaceae bacterium]